MRQRWLTTRHEAITQLYDLGHPNDALTVVSLIGQQHQEPKHGWDQLLRLPGSGQVE